MPSVYTEPIYKGDNISFEQFMLRCARNFGATISIRDMPMDAPIPDEFMPEKHYFDMYDKACIKLKEFQANKSLWLEKRKKEYNDYVKNEKDRINEINDNRIKLKKRYEEILEKVIKWEPPTKDHVGLKEFAINQINESIDFDCSEYKCKIIPYEEWIDVKEYEYHLMREVDYRKYILEENIKRACERTKWVKALKESLK